MEGTGAKYEYGILNLQYVLSLLVSLQNYMTLRIIVGGLYPLGMRLYSFIQTGFFFNSSDSTYDDLYRYAYRCVAQKFFINFFM
jgi:hypothetical protein